MPVSSPSLVWKTSATRPMCKISTMRSAPSTSILPLYDHMVRPYSFSI